MSDQPKKSNFFEKLATFIVDKRNLIFFLYAIAIIASLAAGEVKGIAGMSGSTFDGLTVWILRDRTGSGGSD